MTMIHNDIEQMAKKKITKRKGKAITKNDNKSRNSKIFLKNKTCRRQTLEKRHMKRRESDKTRFMKNLFVTL